MRAWTLLAAALLALCATGCGAARSTPARPLTALRPHASHPPRKPIRLVRWHGPVEHLFFHTLVIHPRLGFRDDATGQGLKDFFVTAGEFRRILSSLYARGWTLVDLRRVARGEVRVPRGRKPLVISEDDVNYYGFERGYGLGRRLVLDDQGNVAVEEQAGRAQQVDGEDLVPIVDRFVAEHPRFSADGAKGVLALTGYDGLFGERVQLPGPGRAAAAARARALAERLKATGWILASHTYGHINLSTDAPAAVAADTARWAALTRPIIGPTDVLIYPFGARPPAGSQTAAILKQAGFTIQCDIDVSARLTHADGVTTMARRHVDGYAFDGQAQALRPFFDVRKVRDAAARG